MDTNPREYYEGEQENFIEDVGKAIKDAGVGFGAAARGIGEGTGATLRGGGEVVSSPFSSLGDALESFKWPLILIILVIGAVFIFVTFGRQEDPMQQLMEMQIKQQILKDMKSQG